MRNRESILASCLSLSVALCAVGCGDSSPPTPDLASDACACIDAPPNYDYRGTEAIPDVPDAIGDTVGDADQRCVTQGFCTPPGGGDGWIPIEAGPPPDRCGIAYPSQCTPGDTTCLVKELCGVGTSGNVDLDNCYYTCAFP